MRTTPDHPPEIESATTPRLIPMHPESIPADDTTLRWVIPAATLGFVGLPSSLPAVLQALLDDGVLATVEVEPAAVRTTLASGEIWRDHGALVRGALQQALADPQLWRSAETDAPRDDLLRAAVLQVIEGQVGDYIRSHGGRVTLLRAADDDVEVSLAGACSHCPAAELTLTCRIETGIRALYPELGRLTARSEPAAHLTRRILGKAQSAYPGLSEQSSSSSE